MKEGMVIRVKKGKEVKGKEMRDEKGEIKLGKLKKKIEYKNEGEEMKNEMKKKVIKGVDVEKINGKKVQVVGVLKVVKKKKWMVKKVEIEVK